MTEILSSYVRGQTLYAYPAMPFEENHCLKYNYFILPLYSK